MCAEILLYQSNQICFYLYRAKLSRCENTFNIVLLSEYRDSHLLK